MRELTHNEREEQFGHIEYKNLKGGWVEITNNFESENLVFIKIPFIDKPVRVHKLIVPALTKAMHVLAGLAQWNTDYEYITEFQTFAPRHKRNKLNYCLSDHSYGIAFDINPGENMPNTRHPTIPNAIVNIFTSLGFCWGGDWDIYRDYMHFSVSDKFMDYKHLWT